MNIELTPEEVRRKLAEDFSFNSTAEVTPIEKIIGQERGLSALRFGMEMKGKGYNIYVSGRLGTGRKTATLKFLNQIAKTLPIPQDWCYVNNFEEPRRPKAISLPTGKGLELKKNMEWFVREMQEALTKSFESDEYTTRRNVALQTIDQEHVELSEKMRQMALDEGFVLQQSSIGLQLIPIVDGKEISEKDFLQLPRQLQDVIQVKRKPLQKKVRSILVKFGELQKKTDVLVEELNKSVANFALEPSFQMMIELYDDVNSVKSFLLDVKNDIVNNLSVILNKNKDKPAFQALMNNYRVNLLVDNSSLNAAPIVTVPHPTHRHIFGYIEKEVNLGKITTDFNLIRGGLAHAANGGFLVISVEELFTDPNVWVSLKRAIRNESLDVEDIPEPMEYLSTRILMPEPIPFSGKVVLIGDLGLYFNLYEGDNEFKELFKVKAEFDTEMEWNDESIKEYWDFISYICHKENLKHIDRQGVAAIIEYGSRLAGNQRKLSTSFREITDLLREVDYYASKDNSEIATVKHVNKALDARVYHSNLIQEKIEEMIAQAIILIDTEGKKTGQVNGLSVINLGNYSFGRPNRVTASIGIGRKGIIDIERETAMGGPIHSKGVMILSGFLNDRYAQEKPLSLTARLVFEQSYSGVEGDSASSTELYAILSALSGNPIKQYLAVTGSVNQKGEVQAIGGINEKIEGFYEVCKVKGLNDKQGVVIPASNVENLVLKEEVVEAIKEGRFHIYPVKTINEGIKILTGIKAGERRSDGKYEEETVNYAVEERLHEMAERMKDYSKEIT